MAEDGHIYEKASIEEWFVTKNTSPMTNLEIGTWLVDM
jgi:hypothetical protein